MSNLILLSGGLDSALCLHQHGAELAVGFDYGQPHLIELEFAERIAAHYGVPFERIMLPMLPKVDDVVFAGRNAVMLAHAAAIAQARGIDTIVIGCNASDEERFPDCRQTFLYDLGNALLDAYGVSVLAPLLGMSKAEVYAAAKNAGIPASWTCYAPTAGEPCGKCYACEKLAETMT